MVKNLLNVIMIMMKKLINCICWYENGKKHAECDYVDGKKID